jgi:hypothetical protein
MKATLLVRLARLEGQKRFAPSAIYEYGWIARLPKDYVGERHRVEGWIGRTAEKNLS